MRRHSRWISRILGSLPLLPLFERNRGWLRRVIVVAAIGVSVGGTLAAGATSTGGIFRNTAFPAGVIPLGAALGDFNRDGKRDLAIVDGCADASCSSNGSVSILLGRDGGGFDRAIAVGVGVSPVSVAVGDFNGDGIQDLAVPNHLTLDVSIVLGRGDGRFGTESRLSVSGIPTFIIVGDFNQDHVDDLAILLECPDFKCGEGRVSVMPGLGNGSFGPPIQVAIGSHPVAGVIADFNQDGRPDLAVADRDRKSVVVGKECRSRWSPYH